MAGFRVECPECRTSYANTRIGVRDLQDHEQAIITVKCLVCGKDFDTTVRPNIVIVVPGWFQRTVMRRKPVAQQDGFTSISTQR